MEITVRGLGRIGVRRGSLPELYRKGCVLEFRVRVLEVEGQEWLGLGFTCNMRQLGLSQIKVLHRTAFKSLGLGLGEW